MASVLKKLVFFYNFARNRLQLWRISDSHHRPGLVVHTVGWPMDLNSWGGSFEYHMNDNLVRLFTRCC